MTNDDIRGELEKAHIGWLEKKSDKTNILDHYADTLHALFEKEIREATKEVSEVYAYLREPRGYENYPQTKFESKMADAIHAVGGRIAQLKKERKE